MATELVQNLLKLDKAIKDKMDDKFIQIVIADDDQFYDATEDLLPQVFTNDGTFMDNTDALFPQVVDFEVAILHYVIEEMTYKMEKVAWKILDQAKVSERLKSLEERQLRRKPV